MSLPPEVYLKQIVIIGAGISGLACANRLRDEGLHNIIILEARNRIGGRTWTRQVNSYPRQEEEVPMENFIEFGAEWIHGERGNIIYNFATLHQLLNEDAPDYYKALITFNEFYFTREETSAIESLLEYLDVKLSTTVNFLKEDANLSDFLANAFTEYLEMQKDLSRVKLLKGAYEWFCKFNCEMNGAQNLSLVSTRLLNEYKECDGCPNVQLKSGFASVVSVMYEKLNREMVRLNHVVDKIDWKHFKSKKDNTDNEDSESPICTMSPKIKIFCNNGESYYADHVVVTIPLGCLKKQCDTIFVPRLSESKIKAIQSVGFGTVNKIFLLFKEPFWDPGCIFHVIWDDAFDEMFQDSTESYKTWLKDINRFAYTSGHPQVLCAWVVGEGAVIMENLPKEEVMSNCMELLKKLMKKELPKPEKIYRSKWYSDRQTYGSYSYLSTECNEKTISEIAKPEVSDVLCAKHPILLFAGEATHPSFYSTVHGAYESGIREARRIIEHYRYS